MTESPFNSVAKGCSTCLFCNKENPSLWECGKQGGIVCYSLRRSVIEQGIDTGCDQNFSGWRPIPPKQPRRSLRKWLLETFWEL